MQSKYKTSSAFVHKLAQELGFIARGGEEERGRTRKEDDEEPSKWTWQTAIHP
jgi:hypothetical protein